MTLLDSPLLREASSCILLQTSSPLLLSTHALCAQSAAAPESQLCAAASVFPPGLRSLEAGTMLQIFKRIPPKSCVCVIPGAQSSCSIHFCGVQFKREQGLNSQIVKGAECQHGYGGGRVRGGKGLGSQYFMVFRKKQLGTCLATTPH